jgi:NAD(P)-dependent dehydrogenase (short-subunit alcohol dehydrogenase family)
MSRLLDGRVALVTGGGQGVGQGIARALAAAGAKVAIAQRGIGQGETEALYLRETHGVEACFIATDVTSPADVERMVDATVARFGRLDILVNNAGASFPKRLEDHSDEEMASSFDLNYWAVFRAMRAAFPVMKAQQYGRIINLGSLNGVNAHMFTAAYNASKEAMRALSRTAAVEWGRHGISVNVICPWAASPADQAYFDANPEMRAKILEQSPAGRAGGAEQDIGPAAVFLASESSGYMTGNTLFVDGGGHINGVSWRPDVGS